MRMIAAERVWAEVDLGAIRRNIVRIGGNLGAGTKICAVVKADGYGHGAVAVAKYIEDLVGFYAVAALEEGIELKEAGIGKPVLVLGYVPPSLAAAAAEAGIRLCVFDCETAAALSAAALKAGKKLFVHIKLDTGMNRIGFRADGAFVDAVKQISRMEGLSAEGVFTHFHSADARDTASACAQADLFAKMCARLDEAGIAVPVKHCANSAAAVAMPETCADMVRLGIAMYGLYPSEYRKEVRLEPALSLKSKIVMVKEIEAGETVGYGAAFTALKRTKIATISAGYADGYMRAVSERGYVLIRGKRAPIAGRICMDQFMANVSAIEGCSCGDTVTLIGKDGGEALSMEEVSAWAGSFNYEFACGIHKRVPRLYFADGARLPN